MKKKIKELPEEKEQILLFSWAKTMLHEYPVLKLLEGSMNGVKLRPGVVAKLKKQGCIKKGRPDIHLPVPMGGYASLFIELKKEISGVVSDEQGFYMVDLHNAGNFCAVCHGRKNAKKVILDYLGGKIVKG